jgi:hypothetical protein
MRRFLTLVSLLCLALPAGISVSGCYRNPGANYCNGLGYGLKIGDVDSITLQPQTTGISLAFGQTQQISTPTAYDCKGSGASVGSWSYGTTNNQLVDISPTGMICAGTWNRNSGGGIADYTTCNKPNPLPATKGLPYAVAYITASAASVTSNPVEVYVHAQVTSIALAGVTQQCYSQTTTASLDAQACYADGSGSQVQFCAPAGYQPLGTPGATLVDACPLPKVNGVQISQSSLPTCSASIGALSYAVGNSTIGTINSNTNVITAVQPGTTNITATVAGSASSAGYFSVCPPASVALTTSSGATSATVTQGSTQTLVSSVLDTNGATITGAALTYSSSNPKDIAIAAGSISSNHPGVANLYASCEPGTCNPSPINELGLYGTGLSLSSNGVTITTPGTTSDYVWFGAPNNSQYFEAIDLLTGTNGSTVKLPYVPNSMVMDGTGSSLYFGSSHELMVYSAASNALTKQDNSVPGVVMAVSPNNAYALINDQTRGILYLYNIAAGSSQTFSGMVAAAAWTADSETMYAVDSTALNTSTVTGHTNTLYVYSLNTGWSSYDLSGNGPTPANSGAWTVAAMVPGIGAYLGGPYTQARGWCPSGNVGSSANMILYPLADSQPVQTDVLAATADGNHILGATQTGGGIQLTDLGITIPTKTVGSIAVPEACPYSVNTTTGVQSLGPLTFTSTVNHTTIAGLGSAAVNQLVTSPVSNLTFITYSAPSSNTGAKLPFYLPGAKGSIGVAGQVSLTGASSITAPLAGAFSPDNSLFFVSTQGDNQIHFISIPTSVSTANPPTDTKQLAPALPACSPSTDSGCTYTGSGTVVPATVITVVPRATT